MNKMKNNRISTRDVYNLVDKKIDKLEAKIVHRFELVEKDVSDNKSRLERITGRLTTYAVIIGAVVTVATAIVIKVLAGN